MSWSRAWLVAWTVLGMLIPSGLQFHVCRCDADRAPIEDCCGDRDERACCESWTDRSRDDGERPTAEPCGSSEDCRCVTVWSGDHDACNASRGAPSAVIAMIPENVRGLELIAPASLDDRAFASRGLEPPGARRNLPLRL